jgi:hypothetical protein
MDANLEPQALWMMPNVNQLPELLLVMLLLYSDFGVPVLRSQVVQKAQRISKSKPTWVKPFGSWKELIWDSKICTRIDLTIKETFNKAVSALVLKSGDLLVSRLSQIMQLPLLTLLHAKVMHVMTPFNAMLETAQPVHLKQLLNFATLLLSNTDTLNGKIKPQLHAQILLLSHH